MQCADCKIEVFMPRDAKPDREHRVCMVCFSKRWEAAGKPSDHGTGRIEMMHEGKLVRWSNAVTD